MLFYDGVVCEEDFEKHTELNRIKVYKKKTVDECNRPSEWLNAWSRWERPEYNIIQNKIKEYCNERKECPIEWENRSWIKGNANEEFWHD